LVCRFPHRTDMAPIQILLAVARGIGEGGARNGGRGVDSTEADQDNFKDGPFWAAKAPSPHAEKRSGVRHPPLPCGLCRAVSVEIRRID
jgi:hypothetical protein